jgi:hypothetical protein
MEFEVFVIGIVSLLLALRVGFFYQLVQETSIACDGYASKRVIKVD